MARVFVGWKAGEGQPGLSSGYSVSATPHQLGAQSPDNLTTHRPSTLSHTQTHNTDHITLVVQILQ